MNKKKPAPTYILGINDSHCATAALLKDGKIIACASEERFVRVKNQPGIPQKSIKYCLDEAAIRPFKLKAVVLSSETFPPVIFQTNKSVKKTGPIAKSPAVKLYKIVRHHHYHLMRQTMEYQFPILRKLNFAIYNIGVTLLVSRFVQERRARVSQLLRIPKEKIFFADHHPCHLYAALYSSRFPIEKKSALVFTCDCQGDGLSASVNIFKNNKLKRVAATTMDNSLGALYTEITMLLGMKPSEHEYKVMGLAPYAPEYGTQKAYQILKPLICLDKKKLVFKSSISSELFGKFLRENLSGMRFDWIAGATQRLTEELLVSWIKEAIKKYRIYNIACGGGVFMNVKANQQIVDLPKVKEAFFMPSAGDESNAIGAAYWGYQQLTGNIPQPLENLYLGPKYTKREIEAILRKKKIRKKFQVKFYPQIKNKIVQLITNNEIVAVFSGRMEWGARALGNRSILADASKEEMVETINKMIKKRDFWMPFAPVILREDQQKYLINPKKIKAPYMVLAFDSTRKAQKDLKAAMHPYDKTLRPQVIDQITNPTYHQILKEFKKLTGKSGMLNTSFNIHGEPIVCSLQDALSTFERSGLKYLALENYLVSKNQ